MIDTGLETGRWAELSEEDIEMLQTNPKEQSKGHRSSPVKTKKTARRAAPKPSRSTPRNNYKRRK
ncbi:MAG: hypothetical protein ACI9E1_001730 [Cryomorphaceae bacterium]